MKNADMPAMPIEGEQWADPLNPSKGTTTFDGLTKREHAAIQIMAGFASNPGFANEAAALASLATKCADALFEELEKES